jgi:hypothetical protein
MREKRTVVWERKGKPQPFRRESAERIRARLRPSLFTRIVDAVFDRFETVVERVDAIDQKYSFGKVGATLGILFFGTLFVLVGDIQRAPYYLALLAGVTLASHAYYQWHKKHPLPPVLERRLKHDVIAALHGVAGGAVFAGVHVLSQIAIAPGLPLDWFPVVINGLAVVVGIFMLRTGERPEPKGGQLVGLLGIGLMLVFSWVILEVLI